MKDRSENTSSWNAKAWQCATFRVFCCFLILVATNAQAVQGQEVVVQNDSLVDQACAVVQAGFREGDIGAAVFDLAPNLYPVEIKAVQVYWQSQSPLMQGLTHIQVYGNGGPDPGPPIYTGTGALMTPGYFQQFDSTGLGWIIQQGPFAVGVEYVYEVGSGSFNSLSGHLATDSDGCQSGKNLVYDASRARWFDACGLGTSGDFVIRVLLESQGTGSCFGDAELDGDVDSLDVGRFLECYSGAGIPAIPSCLRFDCDGDTDVDSNDYGAIEACLEGPGTNCLQECGGCVRGGAANTSQLEPILIRRAVPFHLPTQEQGQRTAAFTLLELFVVAVIALAIIAVFVLIWGKAARDTHKAFFMAAADPTTQTEQDNIDTAIIDILALWGQQGSTEADEAFLWYSNHAATGPANMIGGTIQVNDWTDEEREGLDATVVPLGARVVVHEKWVIGSEYSPEVLALILLAEWQHIDCSSCSENSLQVKLKAVRKLLGIEDLIPDLGHGFKEGGL